MEVELRVDGEDAASQMRSLRAWLAGRDELRGRVRAVVAAPGPGTMGSVAEVLTVALGHSGAVAALASVVIAWIRRRSGPVSVSLTRPDGSQLTVNADHVQGLNADQVHGLVRQLGTALDGGGPETPEGGGAGK